MNPPITKKENILEDINGISVSDPYRWLENGEGADVKEWITQQNAYTASLLRTPRQQAFAEELTKDFSVTTFSTPLPVQGHYFYTERKPGEDQPSLYVRTGIEGEPVKLIDPNGKREGNVVSLDYWFPDNTGRFVAYGLSEAGDEMATLRVIDVEKKETLSDEIVRCRYSSVKWLPDSSGFFYTRNPRPGIAPKGEEHLHVKVFCHMLGTDPESDDLVFGDERPKDDMVNLSLSADGRLLAIHVSRTWTENEVYLYDTAQKSLKPLITNIPSHFALRILDDKAILLTNYKANNNRILWAALAEMEKPVDQWKEFVAEREYSLSNMVIAKEKILLEYLVNASTEIKVIDYKGSDLGSIPFPPYSSLSGVGAMKTESEFFYGVESFTFPQIIYRYDPAENKYEVYRKTDNPLNPDQCEVRQEWFVSKDGTKIPIFIFHKKGIALGEEPTILYGYGGFGSSETPAFMRGWVPWILHGGIFAIANIRGGGEFGEHWHIDGIKDKKQNSFDDFIAAAEYLIAQKYTDTKHLGILGASNGGLLVSAVTVERPELFTAVCARVPLTDMVRFPKFGMAVRWVHEYGDPQSTVDLKNILKWSPYHNVHEGIEYPSMLFTTGEKDTRVDPLHSRKMVALLQAVNKNNEVCIYTELEAGHGAGKPVSKTIDLQSLIIGFFAEKLDLQA
jgi:prolyl oligopeptidase